MTDMERVEKALVNKEPVGACPLCGSPFRVMELSSRAHKSEILAVDHLIVECGGSAHHRLEMGKCSSATQREERLRTQLRVALDLLNQIIPENG